MTRLLIAATLFLLPFSALALPAFESSREEQHAVECSLDKKKASIVFSRAGGALTYKPERSGSKLEIENCYEIGSGKARATGRNFLVLEYKTETEYASRPGKSLFYEVIWVDKKGRAHSVLSEDVAKFPVEVEWGEHKSDKLPMLRFLSRDKAGKIKGEMYFKFDPTAEDPVFKAVLENLKPLG